MIRHISPDDAARRQRAASFGVSVDQLDEFEHRLVDVEHQFDQRVRPWLDQILAHFQRGPIHNNETRTEVSWIHGRRRRGHLWTKLRLSRPDGSPDYSSDIVFTIDWLVDTSESEPHVAIDVLVEFPVTSVDTTIPELARLRQVGQQYGSSFKAQISAGNGNGDPDVLVKGRLVGEGFGDSITTEWYPDSVDRILHLLLAAKICDDIGLEPNERPVIQNMP